MTAFTSSASGNWNDPTKWTGGTGSNYPSSAGDTATILANTVMTIPSGITIDCGAVTYQSSTTGTTTVAINGTFNAHGTIAPASNTRLSMGPGSILDLNGNSVTPSGNVTYSFQGVSGNLFTIRSTGSLGVFADSFPNSTTSDMAYGDISALNAPSFGRLVSTGHSYRYVKFHGCQGTVALESGSNTAAATILVSHCDFRDPVDSNPMSASAYQPFIAMSDASSASRLMEYTTFSTGGTNPGIMQISAGNMRYTGNVENGWLFGALKTDGILESVFFSTPFDTSGSQNDVFMSGTGGKNNFAVMRNCYAYYTGGDHAFGFLPNAFDKSATDNVLENGGSTVAGAGSNWFLFGPGTDYAFVGSRNIFLGHGAPYQFAASNQTVHPTTFTISNNTTLVTNGASDPFLPSLLNTEQQAVIAPSGAVNIFNNLIINPTYGPTDVAVYIQQNNANQVTMVDYNVGWTAPGSTIPPVKYLNVVPTNGGPGTHDFATNPNFSDSTRTLATWDAALGGPGTAAHAITQLLAINVVGTNPAYTVAALVSWVRAGFVPRNSKLIGTGYLGSNIGALTPLPDPVIPIRFGITTIMFRT